jgi:hypothetical protein
MLLLAPYPGGTLERLSTPGGDDVFARAGIVENESNFGMKDECCYHYKVPPFMGSDDASREDVCPGEHVRGIDIEVSEV